MHSNESITHVKLPVLLHMPLFFPNQEILKNLPIFKEVICWHLLLSHAFSNMIYEISAFISDVFLFALLLIEMFICKNALKFKGAKL